MMFLERVLDDKNINYFNFKHFDQQKKRKGTAIDVFVVMFL